MDGIVVDNEKTRILVHVQPNASRNEALSFQDGVLRVRIDAPPTKGQANQELVKFLSHILGVSKSSLTIEKGATSKRKVVSISGLTPVEVMRRLERLAGPSG